MARFYRNESGVAVEASWHSVSVAVIEKSFHWASISDMLGMDGSAAAGREDMRNRVAQSLVDTAHAHSWPISGYTYIVIDKDARSSRRRHRTYAASNPTKPCLCPLRGAGIDELRAVIKQGTANT